MITNCFASLASIAATEEAEKSPDESMSELSNHSSFTSSRQESEQHQDETLMEPGMLC
jgi:hypothetical protein